MAAVTTPTDVRPGSTANAGSPVTYGATVGFGKVLYLDAADNTHKLAANNSTAAIASAVGVSVTPGASSEYGYIVSADGTLVTFTGTTFVAGDPYFLGTSGNIVPLSDLTTGTRVTLVGVAATTSVLSLLIRAFDFTHA